jgi:hypothetical protein
MRDLAETYKEIAGEPYEHRGILHSEVALIIHACRRLGVERLIESGRARAQSTYMLAKYMPDVEIHSVEARNDPDAQFGRDRVGQMANVSLYDGTDGAVALPAMCRQWDDLPTAVLCDGPKGIHAVAVVQKCFKFAHVKVGFIHDMRRLDHDLPSPFRAAAEAVFARHKFSDDPAFVAGSSWMDASVVAAGGPCGPQHEAVFGSYGPTIGVFLNPQNQNHEGTSQ